MHARKPVKIKARQAPKMSIYVHSTDATPLLLWASAENCQVTALFRPQPLCSDLFPGKPLVPAHLGVIVCFLDLCRFPSAFVCHLGPNLTRIPNPEPFIVAHPINILNGVILKPTVAAYLCYFSSFLAQTRRKTRCENGHGGSGPTGFQAQRRGCRRTRASCWLWC